MNLPMVATRHSQLAKRHGLAILAFETLDLYFLRRFDAVVAVSDAIANEARQLGISPKLLSTIANGIDMSSFASASQEREVVAGEELKIGTVGLSY